MSFAISALGFFWFARTIKSIFFWLYLWQLKEYHVGRFLDHFRTHKGKKLILNPLLAFKIAFLPLVAIRPLLFAWVLLLIYVFETAVFCLHVIKNNFKKPKFTFKTLLLTSVLLFLTALFLFKTYSSKAGFPITFSILVFDILTPLIVSCVVLFFQPFFVAARNITLKKAKEKINKSKGLIVVAITGSYGKTSTKEFLKTILSSKFNVLATEKNQNSEMGIAKTILSNDFDRVFKQETRALENSSARPSTQKDLSASVFVVEMGSYKKGGIKLLCDMVRPNIGVVTGVNEQHLALFGSMDNLLSAEGGRELAESLPKDGLIILNGDNKYCLDLYKKATMRKKMYSVKKDRVDSDIWTDDVEVEKSYISFIAESAQKEMVPFNVNILGKHNVQNILAAILVAKELGMSLERIAEACENIRQEQSGITLKRGIYGINIIDFSYSSNPNGVMADLDYLNVFSESPVPPEGLPFLDTGKPIEKPRKIIVMPCLIELGIRSSQIHQDIGKKIAEVCDLAIITTKDYFDDIKRGAVESGVSAKRIILRENPKDIFTIITTSCASNDAVLLEGGRPAELIRLLMNQ